MFAVPGWRVSAEALVQQPVLDPKSRNPRDEPADNKRKRKHGDRGPLSAKIDSDDIDKLWKRHPGILATGGSTVKSNPSKKQKRERDAGSWSANSETAGDNSSRSSHPGTAVPPQTTAGQTKSGLKGISNPKQQRNENATRKDRTQEPRQTAKSIKHKDDKQNPSSILGAIIPPQPAPPPATNLTALQQKMRSKLTSARFRHLNQTLYTSSSSAALELFTASPDLFDEYHAGFAQQVKESWPQNPVEGYMRTIKHRGAARDDGKPTPGVLPLPRRKTGSCTIADLGCGDAPLARGCQSEVRRLNLKFHSYDLHAPNSSVVKADMSNLPLRDGEADIAIFCLSLMGLNWVSFVEEAWRVLRGDGKGEVWVAEVKSRFGRVTKGRVVENSVGKQQRKPKAAPARGLDDEELFAEDDRTATTVAAGEDDDPTDVTAFVHVFQRRGFALREGSVDKRNKMFVSMIFTKSGIPTAGKHKGLKWNGKEYQKIHDGKSRYTSGQINDDEDDVSPEEEAKVLKPCVYKTR